MNSDPEIFYTVDPHAEGLPAPQYATERSAGLDLRAAVPADAPLAIEPGKWALVPTGLRIALPRGYEAQVRPRSGLALRDGIGVLNAPGTVDEDYRGEIGVILFNFSENTFEIRRGDRIAQVVINKVEHIAWRRAETLPETERGDGGFGHTGKG